MTDELRAYILSEGLDDWVPFEALRGAAPGSSDEERITVVTSLAEQGLIEVGDLNGGPFGAWTGDSAEWAARMRELLADDPDTAMGIWLRNTPAGDAAARGTSYGQR